MAEVIASTKVKMKKKNRKGLIVMGNDGQRLGMIGYIPGEGFRLFFERDRYKSYEEIRDNLLAVARLIPNKPKGAL